jgi:prepilin-type N-terminal cleavage/methylation domain-containing protein
MKRNAFTLVELLVVIAIIGLLSSIAIVSMNGSREKARIAAGQSFEQSVYQKLGDRLEGEWRFETLGATTPDTSGNGHTGTVTNGTSAAGISGNALSLAGTGYVDVGTMSISGDITVSAWVFPTAANQAGFIIGKNPVNTQWQLFFEGPLRWRGGDPISDAASCPEPSANAWHHVLATQSGTQARVYIDGKQCVSAIISAINNGGGAVQIGTFGDSYNYRGLIDELRVYGGSLID